MAQSYAELKDCHRSIRETHPASLSLRIHRALSWLSRAEAECDDPDARFMFLWIALNAAYAREFSREEMERFRVRGFIDSLVKLDTGKTLHKVLFQQFNGPIRLLVYNKFTFEPFWVALRTHDSSGRWEQSFEGSKKTAMASIMAGDTATVLSLVFDRLYVLRNQLVHGGATWNSQINREQVRDGVAILGTLVPVILSLMMDHPDQEYGDVLYPVV